MARRVLARFARGVIVLAGAAACQPLPSTTTTSTTTITTTTTTTTTTITTSTIPATGQNASVDGAWGPGTFARGDDSCDPGFFSATFTGTAIFSNQGRTLAISDSQTRTSTGGWNGTTGMFTGNGSVGTQLATWTVTVTINQTTPPNLTVSESLRLTQRNNCGATFAAVISLRP